MNKIVICIFIGLTLAITANANKRVVCYYTNWAQYRPEGGKFFPENLDPSLCTNVIFAFARLTGNRLEAFEWNDEDTDWSTGMYTKIMNLKRFKRDLKISLAVGGWNEGSEPFSKIVHDNEARKEFVSTTVTFLLEHKFDGLDLDWEYPGSREGSQESDKPLFTILCRELKAALKPHGLLLSTAVGMGLKTIDKAYEIPEVAASVDWINMMSYDLHGGWEKFVGHNAPLYNRNDEEGEQAELNVNTAVKYWINNGAPPEKLVLGLGTYGRSFKLDKPSRTKPGSAAKSGGKKGKWTREDGFLSYYEICQNINEKNWKVKWDQEAMVPYAYKGRDWVGFDNEKSIEIKVHYARELGLGGIMFWAVDLDDFTGNFCGSGKYPLMNAAVKALENSEILSISKLNSLAVESLANNIRDDTTTHSAIITVLTETLEVSEFDVLCPTGAGYHSKPDGDCSEYYVCLYANTASEQVKYMKCPSGLYFDESIQACDHKAQVKCNAATTKASTTNNLTSKSSAQKQTTVNQNHLSSKTTTVGKTTRCPSGDGYYADKKANCYRYYYCSNAQTVEEKLIYYTCQGDLKFNVKSLKCDSEVNVC